MGESNGRETNPRPQVATITAGIVVTGDVECAQDLQIAGRVQGDVRCATLFVDEDGAVAGGVYAERVRVSGAIDGTMEVGDLAVEAGGRVSGSITYGRLKVSAGGIVEGNLNHRAAETAAPIESDPVAASHLAERPNPRRVYVD